MLVPISLPGFVRVLFLIVLESEILFVFYLRFLNTCNG